MYFRVLLISALIALSCQAPAGAEENEARARRLINALGCKACHSFERSGSMLAPPLNRIGARLTLPQLQEKMAEHKPEEGEKFRPSYATTPPEDMDAILQFLATRK